MFKGIQHAQEVLPKFQSMLTIYYIQMDKTFWTYRSYIECECKTTRIIQTEMCMQEMKYNKT